MSTLLGVQFGPTLAFSFDDIEPHAAHALTAFLKFHLVDTVPPDVIRLDSVPRPRPATSEFLTHLDGVDAYRDGSTTFLEADGVSAWCDTKSVTGGLHAKSDADMRLVCQCAVTLFIELGLTRSWVGIHAAAIALDGKAILLPGDSGCGKSTTFRNAVAAGFDPLSDDMTWITQSDDGFYLHPFSRGYIDGDLPPPRAHNVKLAAIVCPSIVDAPDSQLLPIATPELLDTLIRQSSFVSSATQMSQRFRALSRVIASAPCHRLAAGRTPQDVPPLLQTLLSP